MKKFIFNLTLFLFLALVISFVLDKIITIGLKKSSLPFYKEWNQIYGGKMNSDLLVLGSSKAHYHISPKNIR